MTIREGAWDCPSCGAVGLSGRDFRCTACGSPRPEGARSHLPSGDLPSDDDAGSVNASPDEVHASDDEEAFETEDGGDDVPLDAHLLPEMLLRPPPPARPVNPRAGPAISPRAALVVGVPLLALGVAAIGAALANRPAREVEDTGQITELLWVRHAPVEKRMVIDTSDWSPPPPGAELLRSYRAVREVRRVDTGRTERVARERDVREQVGTRSTVCGQRDLGNGYFEDVTCDEPVYETRTETVHERVPVYREDTAYATRYHYRLTGWQYAREGTAAAFGGAAPPWPSAIAGSGERPGRRYSNFSVRVRAADGREYSTWVDSARFAAARVGQPVRLKLKRGASWSTLEELILLTPEAVP